ERENPGTVMPRSRTGSDQHDRMFGSPKHVGEGMLAGGKLAERIRAPAEIVVAVSELGLGADEADLELTGAPALADTRVENGGLLARVRTDDQQCVGLLDAGDGRIEDIGGATDLGIESVAALDREIDRAKFDHQLLQREHLF